MLLERIGNPKQVLLRLAQSHNSEFGSKLPIIKPSQTGSHNRHAQILADSTVRPDLERQSRKPQSDRLQSYTTRFRVRRKRESPKQRRRRKRNLVFLRFCTTPIFLPVVSCFLSSCMLLQRRPGQEALIIGNKTHTS